MYLVALAISVMCAQFLLSHVNVQTISMFPCISVGEYSGVYQLLEGRSECDLIKQ